MGPRFTQRFILRKGQLTPRKHSICFFRSSRKLQCEKWLNKSQKTQRAIGWIRKKSLSIIAYVGPSFLFHILPCQQKNVPHWNSFCLHLLIELPWNQKVWLKVTYSWKRLTDHHFEFNNQKLRKIDVIYIKISVSIFKNCVKIKIKTIIAAVCFLSLGAFHTCLSMKSWDNPFCLLFEAFRKLLKCFNF